MFLSVYFIILCSANTFSKSVLPDDGSLNLTPLVENGEAEKARKLSNVDPTFFAGVSSHAAYFTVNKTGLWNSFFWFFPAPERPLEETPWIIWLQGGPGGSSLFGLFTEIGPLRIFDGKAEKMETTWGSDYSLLFIDNPVGTGFSYSEGGEYATDEDMIGACLLNFLQQFLEVFPELRKAPLYLAGESYAGKYIPAFGHYIHNNKDESRPINLTGLMIGDGWIDPPSLLHYSGWALQVGLLDHSQAAQLNATEESARRYWDQHDYENYEIEANRAWDYLIIHTRVNAYNYLKEFDDGDDFRFEIFLNDPKVQSALHVKRMEYKSLSDIVHFQLSGDLYMTVKHWLEELLEHYKVLCYSGQLDVIVGYSLSVHTYRSLNWTGLETYLNADRTIMMHPSNGKHPIAYLKKGGNLLEAIVRGAGHMVPADKPVEIKALIDYFVLNI